MPIPDSYVPAAWRGTTCCDANGDIGIELEQPDGVIHRFRLHQLPALDLAQTILEFQLRHLYETRTQSDKSSGTPSAEGSPAEGQKV